MMPRQGMSVQREQTKQFIGENPSSLILTRNVKVDDGAGGHKFNPTPQGAQTVRIISQGGDRDAIQRRTVGGEVVTPEVKIIFEYDGNVQRGDTFSDSGTAMEVVWVHDFGYQKIAEGAAS